MFLGFPGMDNKKADFLTLKANYIAKVMSFLFLLVKIYECGIDK